MYCKNCGAFVDKQSAFCTRCGAPAGAGAGYCPNCGQTARTGDLVCGRCGSPLQGGPPPYSEPKSRTVAGLLGILLGWLGIHNFYLGFTNKAIIQLVVSTVGGAVTCGLATAGIGIWGFVEGIMLLTGSIDSDAQGVRLKD